MAVNAPKSVMRIRAHTLIARIFTAPFEGRLRENIMRSIRPTGNVLPGYRPSYAMQRVETEAG